MQEKTRAIILRSIKYGDDKMIVDMLSREHGRMSVVWRKPKTAKSKVGRQYFQPLSILEIGYERRSLSSLPVLKEARFAETYSELQFDHVKQSVAFFVAEFLSLAVREEQADSRLYDFVENILLWYDVSNGATANFHLMFMMRVTMFLGFYPDVESYKPNSYFDMRAGCFVQSIPLHKDFLKPSDASFIITLMRMSPANMHLFRMSHTERNNIVELLLNFYSLHIPSFRTLKSWGVLKEIFSSV